MEVPTSLFPWLARATMIQSRGDGAFEFDPWLERSNCPDRVRRIVKAPVGAISATGGDYRFIVSAFVESLRTRSVFARLLDGGMTRIPMWKRVGFTSANATGWVVGEGKPKPLSSITLTSQILTPTKVAALVTLTEEAVRDVGAAGQAFFTRELRGAVSDTVDAKFFEILSDGLSTGSLIPSAGNDVTAIKADLRAAMMAITTGGNSALFWVMASDVAKAASTFPEIFPAMSPQGGEMTNLPALVTTALDDGVLVLIDASGIAGDLDDIAVRGSNQADIEMADASLAQDATTGTGASMVSMFQTDGLALLAETSFRCRGAARRCGGDDHGYQLGRLATWVNAIA